MKTFWIIHIFCSLFMLVGAGLSFWTLRGILKARSITHWPTVEATITQCDFKEEHDADDGSSYEVVVDYTYTVLGRKYENNAIHPAYLPSPSDGHRRLDERLKDVKAVRARYNAADAAEAYLVTGSYSVHWTAFFAGLFFLSAGIFTLLMFRFVFAGNSDYAAGLDVIR